MEVITDSNWDNIQPFYSRYNALFPVLNHLGTLIIKYINSLETLQKCSWTAEITFASVMNQSCFEYIINNPQKFPQLRCIILSGHDTCIDKDMIVPTGLGRLSSLTEFGLEYCASCRISESLPNIRKLHLNELAVNMHQTIMNDDQSWVREWFPSDCKICIN